MAEKTGLIGPREKQIWLSDEDPEDGDNPCGVCGQRMPLNVLTAIFGCHYDCREPHPIDVLIGRLDRLLSEFLLATETKVDEADWQTLKHHAQDLIGVGQKGLLNLKANIAETAQE